MSELNISAAKAVLRMQMSVSDAYLLLIINFLTFSVHRLKYFYNDFTRHSKLLQPKNSFVLVMHHSGILQNNPLFSNFL